MPRRSTRIVEAVSASVKKDNLKVAQLYNPDISDDSDHDDLVKKAKVKRQYTKRTKKQENDMKSVLKKTNKNTATFSPSAPKEDSLVRAKRGRMSTNSSDSEPVLKRAKTIVYEKPSNNNEDKAASESVSNVEVKKESVEEISRCRCGDECPELVKTNKIKTLLSTTSTDSNSNFIIQLKEILSPVNESLREYVEEDDTVRIKTEPVTVKTEPKIIKAEPEGNDDDPDDPAPISSTVPASQNRAPAPPVVVKNPSTASNKNSTKVYNKPKVERMMNCLLCSNKDGKNLSGYDAVRYHVSVCLFATGAYVPFLPHKQGQVTEIEEYGRQFRYKCQVENCEKSSSKSKAMGYREFSMHMGSNHGILERWAEKSDKDGAKELYHSLKNWREQKGETFPENPNYSVEEVHTCLLCHGEGDGGKETKALSFAPDKIKSTRYHYASCLFDFGDGVYLEKYKPDPENVDADGTINDLLGKKFKYTCEECPSKKPRPMGYKEFTTHMAHQHGGLEEILSEHKDPKLRDLVKRMR